MANAEDGLTTFVTTDHSRGQIWPKQKFFKKLIFSVTRWPYGGGQVVTDTSRHGQQYVTIRCFVSFMVEKKLA
jgi:hypothetical protein